MTEPRKIPALHELGTVGRDICTEYYAQGYQHGVVAGLQQADDEWRGLMEVSASIARQIAKTASFAELCDRRGEPEKAARQRATLAENGVTS